ncbi:MAG: hypothetical protein OQK32_05305 [Gammaproteobacteria bacterium]|nr:hypothetical protein [Gammaproteobacteria bacterium]
MKPASMVDIKTAKLTKQYEDRDPEADAQAAIEKGDLRLLGFAGRNTTISGVSAEDRQPAMDACGVRLMEGFGDVLRSQEELQARQLAYKYAIRYNTVVLAKCFKKE